MCVRADRDSGLEQSPAEVLFQANASGEGGPKSTAGCIGVVEEETWKVRASFLTKNKMSLNKIMR
jgi:hypothetical protein